MLDSETGNFVEVVIFGRCSSFLIASRFLVWGPGGVHLGWVSEKSVSFFAAVLPTSLLRNSLLFAKLIEVFDSNW